MYYTTLLITFQPSLCYADYMKKYLLLSGIIFVATPFMAFGQKTCADITCPDDKPLCVQMSGPLPNSPPGNAACFKSWKDVTFPPTVRGLGGNNNAPTDTDGVPCEVFPDAVVLPIIPTFAEEMRPTLTPTFTAPAQRRPRAPVSQLTTLWSVLTNPFSRQNGNRSGAGSWAPSRAICEKDCRNAINPALCHATRC